MGFRKLISWVGSWLFSSTAQESGGRDVELQHDEDQPGNKKRKTTHDSMVIYDQEQGSLSASSSQPICHSNWHVSHKKWALKYRTNQLFARALDVCKALEHDEIQPKKMRRMEVQHWLKAVDQIRDEVQNIATDDQSIANFTSQVDELLQCGNFPHGYVLPDHSPTELPLPSKNPAGEMFTSNTATILEWLKNNERCIIGVYGMGGVGKTTMLRWIYNELLKQDIFGRPLWVTVSQNCDEHKLQNEIAKELGVDLTGYGDDKKRAAILYKRLSTMGPTVLILDDMWKWNSFMGKDIECPPEGSSCKIILSSRSFKVCQEMGCKDFVIEAKVLPESEAWNLFIDKLGHYETLPEEAKELARLVVKECGGLPLAIATMGRSMNGLVDVHEWKNVLNELRQPTLGQVDMKKDVLSILKYSYDRLNDQTLQNCFLSCVLYPEDCKIYREKLIDEWIMQGLLDDAGSRSEQLNKGYALLNKLVHSCLLEACIDENSIFYKMHDLMRDLAIMITKGYPCFMVKSGQCLEDVPKEKLWCKDLVKVSLSWNRIKKIPCGMAPLTPELTVLTLNGNPLKEIPGSFFVNMRALTTLDLSQTFIQRLPESVSDLENLRGLLLGLCKELTYVPSLMKLSKLRVLDLIFVKKLEQAPKGIEKLKCLETISYCPWDISDYNGFNELVQSSLSLSCYRFWLRDPLLFKTIVGFCQGGHCEFFEDVENVVVVAGAKIGDDEATYLLPETIKELDIFKCDINRSSLGDVFPTLGVAIGLRKLSVRHCKRLEYVSSSSSLETQQSPIEEFYLKDLPDLRRIADIRGCCFPHLRRLVIDDCPKIKVIFPLTEQQFSLPNLKELDVSRCRELEEIFESNSGFHPNFVLALPNLVRLNLFILPKLRRLYMNLHLYSSLEVLKVSVCKELEEIYEDDGLNSSSSSAADVDPMNACNPQLNQISAPPKLREIRMEDLPKLRSIYKDLNLCTSLKDLYVVNCPKIEHVFESNNQTQPNSVLALPNLVSLNLRSLPKLRRLHMNLHLCNLLEVVKVLNCEDLEELFESSGSNSLSSSTSHGEVKTLVVDPINACNPKPNSTSFLPKLWKLVLWKLPKLGSIYKDLHLCTSLQHLEVGDCPMIVRIFEATEPILALCNIRTLYLLRLPNLSSIYRGLLLCTSLMHLNLEGCIKLKRMPLSNHLICDDSPSSLLSLPLESDNPKLWTLLWRDYFQDAHLLSGLIRCHAELE